MAESTGLLGRIRRDIERNALRAKNGIKVAAGIDEPELGVTPKDVVWAEDRAELWHYQSDAETPGPPVLIIYSLMNQSYILDLYPGNSFIEKMLDAGFDVFMLDWGRTDERDAHNALEDYTLHYMDQAVDRVLEITGHDSLNMIGYCMGGMLAMIHVAAHKSEKINSLTVLTVPADMEYQGITADMMRDGRMKIEDVIDESGNVPADSIRRIMSTLKPTAEAMNYVNLLDKMYNDEYVHSWRAITRWSQDHIPMPGALMKQFTKMIVQDNGFKYDKLRLNGKRISFKDITVPFLHLRASKDHIVPPACSVPVLGLVGSDDKEEVVIEAGHVGIFISRLAGQVTVPTIIDFINRNAEDPAVPVQKGA